MRKLLLPLLLASAASAAPALSQPVDVDEDRGIRIEERRSDRSESRRERAERRGISRVERQSAPVIPDERAESPGAQAAQGATDERTQVLEERRALRQAIEQRRLQRQQEQQAGGQGPAGSLQHDGESRVRWGEIARQGRQRVRPPEGARPDRPAPPQVAESRVSSPQWHGTWRRDGRYDWRRWRDRHRSLFRLGFYFDPFGWSYHRWGVGWRLWPAYYDRQYWLHDPWSFRLPYAPWPYRWVRYYDDALLVNTITGRVVDVEYNFFW